MAVLVILAIYCIVANSPIFIGQILVLIAQFNLTSTESQNFFKLVPDFLKKCN